MLAALCALVALLATPVAASAGVPTLTSSFACSSVTPCGSNTSWSPTRLAVNTSTGDVYVVDSINNVVDVFDASGTYLSNLTVPAGSGGQFGFNTQFPTAADDDIAVDNSGGATEGNVYVVGEQNGGPGLISAFDSSGTFLWQVAAPSGADTCGVDVDGSGHLWTADFTAGIQQRDVSNGALVGSAILASRTTCHFAIDSDGNFYVAHWNSKVDKYDASGNVLVQPFDAAGVYDVAVDATHDNTVYTEHSNSVGEYASDGTEVDGSPFGGPVFGGTAAITTPARGVDVNGPTHTLYVADAGSANVLIFDIPVPKTLTIHVSGTTVGSLTSDSGGIECGSGDSGTCSAQYDPGTVVTLTAPDHSRVTSWNVTGDPSTTCTGTVSSCTVTMNDDVTVNATIDALPNHVLTVHIDGKGHVTGGGIDCSTGDSGTCSITAEEGTSVLLTAAAEQGATFDHWTGGGCSTTLTCNVTLSDDTNVTATFTLRKPVVAGEAASGITQTGATLAGTVNPDGNATTCTIEWGTTTSYGTAVPCSTDPGSGTSPVAVTIPALSGLAAGTTYHWRLDAQSAGGTTSGSDQSFTTAAAIAPPKTCATDPSLCPATTGQTPPPPPGPGAPKLPRTAKVSGGIASIVFACKGAAGSTCKGKLTLTAKIKKKIKKKVKKRKRTKTVTKTIKVGHVSYNVAAGKTVTLRVKLSSAAKSALKKGSLKVSAKGLKGSIKLPKTVVKKKHNKKKHHKKHHKKHKK